MILFVVLVAIKLDESNVTFSSGCKLAFFRWKFFSSSSNFDGLFPDNISLNKNDYYNKLLTDIFKNFYDKNFKQYILLKKNSNNTIEKIINLLIEEQFIIMTEFKNNYKIYIISDDRRNCVKKYLKEGSKSAEILNLLNKFDECDFQ